MSKNQPLIQKHMTVQPQTISSTETVKNAQKQMSEWNVRHLPVVDEDKLVGESSGLFGNQ